MGRLHIRRVGRSSSLRVWVLIAFDSGLEMPSVFVAVPRVIIDPWFRGRMHRDAKVSANVNSP